MKNTIKIGDFSFPEYSQLIENKCLTMYNRKINFFYRFKN